MLGNKNTQKQKTKQIIRKIKTDQLLGITIIIKEKQNKKQKFKPVQKCLRVKGTLYTNYFHAKVILRAKVMLGTFLTPNNILYNYLLYVSFKICSLYHIIREI